jgi:hypothetical protein
MFEKILRLLCNGWILFIFLLLLYLHTEEDVKRVISQYKFDDFGLEVTRKLGYETAARYLFIIQASKYKSTKGRRLLYLLAV